MLQSGLTKEDEGKRVIFKPYIWYAVADKQDYFYVRNPLHGTYFSPNCFKFEDGRAWPAILHDAKEESSHVE